ncbi:MAG: type pilus biosis protein PilB [Fibrobacteres bacterium]|nr:type pilus biosis protein PilB [Fibrobacterota bacterium]
MTTLAQTAVEAGPVVENLAPLKTTLLAYRKESLQQFAQLLKAADVGQFLQLFAGNFGHADKLQCEMALAIFSPGDSLEAFVHDVATLKLIAKVPCLLAVVNEGGMAQVAEAKTELAVDDILYLPLPPQELGKILKTYVASLRIEYKKKSQRMDFTKKAQALGAILVENGIITSVQLKKALDFQKETTNLRLGDALVSLGFIDEFQKTHFLASQLGVPVATPKQFASADLNVVALIPERVAREYHCIALEKQEDELTVAMLDTSNLRLLDNLRDQTDLRITPILGTLEDISVSIDRYYRDIASHRSASDLMADLATEVQYIKKVEEEMGVEEAASAGAELGIIKLVNMLIANAVRDRASDIHIEPMEKELSVRYRIDGELRRVMSPPRHSHQAIVTRIKILSDLNIAERRLPQDGRMVVKIGLKEVDVRVSILPTIFGEKCVLRILDKEAYEKSMYNLGFTDHELKIFRENIGKPHGMIVVTGPTGSGKSTTLYSALQQIKDVTSNIITVEDPVEYHMEGVTQVHVNAAIGMSFANALRSILRQDPDTILIGEIRDNETADIAVKMALTGHMVFSSLHTNDASSAVARFVDIGIPPLLLASSLNLVVAQRLVRKICTRCKVPYTPSMEMIEQLHLPVEDAASVKFHMGEGCVTCNGVGYQGRIGIFEMLNATREIKKLILKNASTMDIQACAEREGMKTLRQAGIELVLRGDTTIEQVLAATTEL